MKVSEFRVHSLSRRDLIGAGATALFSLAAGVLPQSLAAQGRLPKTRRWAPIKFPVETPPNLPLLTCAPAAVDMGDGVMRGVWAYNGLFPGPTWVARTGDTVTTRLVNGLSEPTITHWHGLVVDYVNDGGPTLEVPVGSAYDYKFKIIQRAGLNFYHPHQHMATGKQVAMGLSGAFIIRDSEEDDLRLPSGPYEVPIVLRDAKFDNQGNMTYNASGSGFNGQFPIVSGMLSPMLAVDRGVYRFRVLNGANARVFRLEMSNGLPFTIIGNDGGLLERADSAGQIELGMGERLDLLVDFTSLAADQEAYLRCGFANWNLVKFVGTGAAGVGYAIPRGLSKIVPLVGPSTPTRIFSFDGMSRINGQRYDMHRIDFQVPFGVVERWRFVSGGNAPHPVHVHGASFQVISRTGGRGRLFPWESGWKDTVLLNDHESVDVLIRFDGYRGKYVIHCHLLEHEDMGMMSNFEVV